MREARRVVDPDGERPEGARGLGVSLFQSCGPRKPVRIFGTSTRLGAHHTIRELLARHFEAEDRDADARRVPPLLRVVRELVVLRLRGVRRDVEDEGSCPCRGGRDDRQVALVEARRLAIEAVEARGVLVMRSPRCHHGAVSALNAFFMTSRGFSTLCEEVRAML